MLTQATLTVNCLSHIQAAAAADDDRWKPLLLRRRYHRVADMQGARMSVMGVSSADCSCAVAAAAAGLDALRT